MKQARWMRLIVIILVGISLTTVALPQSFTGSVSGRVIDQQNAVIGGATLTLKNLATNATRQATVDDEGNYQFISVAPGTYEITAEMKAKGFSTAKINIEVTVAGSVRADITLRPAGVAGQELGEANTTAPNLEALTKTTNVTGEVLITQRQIVELPLLTRNIYELVALAPGAALTSESNPQSGGLVGTRGGAGIGLAVNGQRSSSGNYVLDGGENNNSFDAGPAQVLPLDSIKEFRVLTNNYTAEYGRNAGFIANIVSNTGTNGFHGSLYDFIRNSALAANSFNNNANGIDKPVFNRHQFGGAIGGPIVKDKLFFFGTAEAIIVRSQVTTKFYVPTPELLKISSVQTNAIFQSPRTAIPNDRSTTDVIRQFVCPVGVDCQKFPDQIRDIAAFAAVTRTGPGYAGAGNPQDTVLASGRIDYNINSQTQFFGRYSIDDEDIFAPVQQPYSQTLDQGFRARNHNILLNLTRIWSNRLVTESRLVYGRSTDDFPATAEPGKSNYFPAFFAPFLPATLPSGSDGFGGTQNLYQVYQTVNLAAGDHVFKFGGQYTHIRDNRIPPVLKQLPVGYFYDTQSLVDGQLLFYQITFDPKGATPGKDVTPPFAAGIKKRHYRYNETALFFQDTWKINRRLTLSPGLRWEYLGVLHSAGAEKALDANFYYGTGNNIFERIANGSFATTSNAPGEDKGHFYRPDYNNFAPRLGLAYDLFGDGKTVFRSGSGVFYDRTFGNQLENVALNPPSYALQTYGGDPSNLIPFGSEFVTRSPYQPIETALQGSPIPLGFVPARHLDQNLRTAYSIAWNASLSRQINRNLAAEITYVGSSGVKLYSITNNNRSFSAKLLDPNTGKNALLDQIIDGVPFPAVAELNTRGNLGHSSYHALQLRIESSEFKNIGLQFGANYTWSHAIDNISSVFQADSLTSLFKSVGFLDSFNPGLDRGDADFDIRHRFVTNFIWIPPYGEHAKNWAVRNVLAGWGISGILSFQTGQPFSIFDSGADGFGFQENPRPLFAGSATSGNLQPDATTPNAFQYLKLNDVRPSGDCAKSTGPFYCAAPVSGPFDGTLPRNTFRRPGTQFHNLALQRNFALPKVFGREGARLQLRAEFYNPFNHSNLYLVPGTNDINAGSFTAQSGTARVPSVIAVRGKPIGLAPTAGVPSFIDNRLVVFAAKFNF
jgi:Carboxypeptidase regulatory-like domain/TonB dependent receptor-like, beta-barrel/TonB-dependent Receptor Plug Domain